MNVLYPITQVYFRCDGCGAEWMIRPDPAIACIDDLKRFTDEGKMGPCPKSCGGRSCSMVFKAPGGRGVDDPFALFDSGGTGKASGGCERCGHGGEDSCHPCPECGAGRGGR